MPTMPFATLARLIAFAAPARAAYHLEPQLLRPLSRLSKLGKPYAFITFIPSPNHDLGPFGYLP
eukprot:3380087-Prymnesium_polylepis.1